MSINNPASYPGLNYLYGLALSNDATTPDEVVSVSAGQCKDSTGFYDMTFVNDATVDITVSGANGLDTGTVAASTLYSVYAIGASDNSVGPALLLSTSHTGAVTFPDGYDVYRRLGSVRTDGTSDILTFDQRGNNWVRTMWYRTAIATDVTAGAAAAWAAVDVSGSIPVGGITGLFRVAFTPTAGDDTVFLRCGDSADDAPQATMSGSVAAVAKTGNLECPVGTTLASGIDYEVIGTATAINVQGYVDQL